MGKNIFSFNLICYISLYSLFIKVTYNNHLTDMTGQIFLATDIYFCTANAYFNICILRRKMLYNTI